ncbi:hypothetical protein [Streptomyces sp. 147326]|uniref:hypothetical protein n=1 Tax=Streptomyces sp. 147326 TaxID=3074379 RepID=UPI0038574CCF
MTQAPESLSIRVLIHHTTTDRLLSEVGVEAVAGDQVVAKARTDGGGFAALEIGEDLWREPLTVRIDHGDRRGQEVPVTREALFDEEPIRVAVCGEDHVDPGRLAILADHLVATRRVLADNLADDLTCPPPDSMIRLLTPGERARLLDDLSRADGHGGEGAATGLVDPDALRNGTVSYLPLPELDTHFDFDTIDLDDTTWPKPIWGLFPWALPDDQAYRDYLRGVFVLFAHQQKRYRPRPRPVARSLTHPSSLRTACRRPEERLAVISVKSDLSAHLHQQPGRPGGPGGHSSEATPSPPRPPYNLRRTIRALRVPADQLQARLGDPVEEHVQHLVHAGNNAGPPVALAPARCWRWGRHPGPWGRQKPLGPDGPGRG